MTALRHGVLFCVNCDQVQPREIARYPRMFSREDIRYRLYWMNIFRTEYPPLPPGVSETWVDDAFGGTK